MTVVKLKVKYIEWWLTGWSVLDQERFCCGRVGEHLRLFRRWGRADGVYVCERACLCMCAHCVLLLLFAFLIVVVMSPESVASCATGLCCAPLHKQPMWVATGSASLSLQGWKKNELALCFWIPFQKSNILFFPFLKTSEISCAIVHKVFWFKKEGEAENGTVSTSLELCRDWPTAHPGRSVCVCLGERSQCLLMA